MHRLKEARNLVGEKEHLPTTIAAKRVLIFSCKIA
jgi:hypothetical protein